MIGGRMEQARFKSDFYRDNYYKLLNAIIVSCVIILLLIGAIIYLILFHPEPSYYATSLGGQIIPMTPIAAQKG